MDNREIWDLYNEKRELTGRDHIRGEEIPQGYYHLVVHVWIRDGNAKEEVGIDLSPDDGRIVFSMVGRVVNAVPFSDIVDVWLFEYDGPVDLDKATTKEVAQTAWLNREEIKELYVRGDLVYTLGYFFEIDDFGE